MITACLFLQAAQKAVDTSSDWKEFTSPDGRKYYHNRKTKESKWTMPEEMKRAQAAAAAANAAGGPAAAQAQKPAATGAPQLVKVPVAQSTSPTHAQKSSQVCCNSCTIASAVVLSLRFSIYACQFKHGRLYQHKAWAAWCLQVSL